MFLRQKVNPPKTEAIDASLRAYPTYPAIGSEAGETEQEAQRRGAQAAVEDYLDRVCLPLVETLPYGARKEMRREVAAHLKAIADAYEELGDSPLAATHKALAKFGNPEKVARLWRESSALGGVSTRGEQTTRWMRRQWPGISVTLSALFLLAGWLSPLHSVSPGKTQQGVGASSASATGSGVSAAGLSIPGFHHTDVIRFKNCAECHRAPANQPANQRFLLEQTRQWMDTRHGVEKSSAR